MLQYLGGQAGDFPLTRSHSSNVFYHSITHFSSCFDVLSHPVLSFFVNIVKLCTSLSIHLEVFMTIKRSLFMSLLIMALFSHAVMANKASETLFIHAQAVFERSLAGDDSVTALALNEFKIMSMTYPNQPLLKMVKYQVKKFCQSYTCVQAYR